jgi:hypothetical protein
MSNNKLIVLSIIALTLVSAVYLSWIEKKQADLDLGKNWWALSFFNPKSEDISFVIENHSDSNNFHWEVVSGGDRIKEDDISIAKGATWTSDVQADNLAGKIIIRVSSGSDKKEIYKQLEN